MTRGILDEGALQMIKRIQEAGAPFKALALERPRATLGSERLMEATRRANAFKHGFAWTMVEALRKQMLDVQSELKADEEVGALLASFGQGIEISVGNITHEHPHLIVITGWEVGTGKELRLLQHVNQVSLLFRAVPAKELPARRIGFAAQETDDGDDRREDDGQESR
jgi:hypothetical protein